MAYIAIPVPEEHIPDVYELLASLTRSTTAPLEVDVETQLQLGPDASDDRLPRLLRNVIPSTRDMLVALAKRAGEELRYEDLTEATGQDIGGPLKSLQIQSRRLRMDEPIHRRDVNVDFGDGQPPRKRKVYWMDAATAAEILRITNGGA